MRYRIAIVVPGMPLDEAAIEARSLGGSETAGIQMATALAKRGHDVVLFCPIEQPALRDGVRFLPLASYETFCGSTPHDVAIIQRQAALALGAQINAKCVLVWCHDLLQKRHAPAFLGARWAWDRLLVPSAWMREQYREVTDIAPDRFVVVRNGIDLEMIARARDEVGDAPRDHKRFLYGSRFERGVDVLLEHMMPAVWKLDPEVTLDICGYDHQVDHLQSFYAAVRARIDELGPRVRWLGHLTKPELYRHMHRIGGLLYPGPSPLVPRFAETSCIIAMEAMACGLPVVASGRGALPETLGEAGIRLVPGDADNPEHIQALASNAWAIANQQGASGREAGLARAAGLGWDEPAELVEATVGAVLAEATRSRWALAASFAHRQDIEAARIAIAMSEGDSDTERLSKQLDIKYAFAQSEKSMADYYNTLTVDDYEQSVLELLGKPERFDGTEMVPRMAQIVSIVGAADDVRTALEFGCAHGELAINLARLTGRRVLAVDLDERAIERGTRLAEAHAGPARPLLSFHQIDRLDDLDGITDDYLDGQGVDALVAAEVLEHVVDPFATLAALHRMVRVGGLVVITMPWGPWEDQAGKPPQHIREWNRDDLIEIFADMNALSVQSCFSGLSHGGEPCGYTVVSYRVPEVPLPRPINWVRKIRCQRPRQTMAVNMLVGGPKAHETLHWSLASVAPIASRIIIGDTGMTAESVRIAESYGADIVEVGDPREIGFDEARNALLEVTRRTAADWVLWLDSDERLIDARMLRKYLRDSDVHTFAIRQHHWAVDMKANPDIPGRLFRLRALDGKLSRFFGVVHEHPELELNKGNGPTMILGDVTIGHVGYYHESVRRGRFERNAPLLARDVEKYPDRELQKHLLIRDRCIEATRILETTRNVMTPEVLVLLNEVVALYRAHFLGKPTRPHLDTLGYYSFACRTLGIGVDCDIELRVAKDGNGTVGPNAIRFASVEDMLAEINQRLIAETKDFNHPWW